MSQKPARDKYLVWPSHGVTIVVNIQDFDELHGYNRLLCYIITLVLLSGWDAISSSSYKIISYQSIYLRSLLIAGFFPIFNLSAFREKNVLIFLKYSS